MLHVIFYDIQNVKDVQFVHGQSEIHKMFIVFNFYVFCLSSFHQIFFCKEIFPEMPATYGNNLQKHTFTVSRLDCCNHEHCKSIDECQMVKIIHGKLNPIGLWSHSFQKVLKIHTIHFLPFQKIFLVETKCKVLCQKKHSFSFKVIQK